MPIRRSAARPSAVFRVAGCATGRPCSAASSLTGEARSSRPRPAGRSGCVSTPTTRCRDCNSARSAGSAKCGVPANAIRNEVMDARKPGLSFELLVGARRGGLARAGRTFFSILVELLANALALEIGEIVDEQLALRDDPSRAAGRRPRARRAATSKVLPVTSCARARITAARFTSSKMPGTDRQPSSVTPTPSALRISGLQNTSGSCLFSETSMTIKRLWKSTWVAARPTPGAAYMVSNMSAANLARASSNTSTGFARVRSRGSGYSRICRRAMKFRSIAANVWMIRPWPRSCAGHSERSSLVIQRTDLTIDRAHRAAADYNSGVRLPHPGLRSGGCFLINNLRSSAC